MPFNKFSSRVRLNAVDFRNIYRWEKRRKEIDLAFAKHFTKEGIFSADVSLWIDGMDNECECVHSYQDSWASFSLSGAYKRE